MEIKRTIKLNIEKVGNSLLIGDATTLCLVIGSSAVCGNLSFYGVTKLKNKYSVPIDVIKNRIKILEQRKNNISNKLEMMKQVIK